MTSALAESRTHLRLRLRRWVNDLTIGYNRDPFASWNIARDHEPSRRIATAVKPCGGFQAAHSSDGKLRAISGPWNQLRIGDYHFDVAGNVLVHIPSLVGIEARGQPHNSGRDGFTCLSGPCRTNNAIRQDPPQTIGVRKVVERHVSEFCPFQWVRGAFTSVTGRDA